jgi:hypothetical protein
MAAQSAPNIGADRGVSKQLFRYERITCEFALGVTQERNVPSHP